MTCTTTGRGDEAERKLFDRARGAWRDRGHFLALASLAMRHRLVARARARSAPTRGGERRRIPPDDDLLAAAAQPDPLHPPNEPLRAPARMEPTPPCALDCLSLADRPRP